GPRRAGGGGRGGGGREGAPGGEGGGGGLGVLQEGRAIPAVAASGEALQVVLDEELADIAGPIRTSRQERDPKPHRRQGHERRREDRPGDEHARLAPPEEIDRDGDPRDEEPDESLRQNGARRRGAADQ